MKIFKNIIKNKALFISFLAFCFSLFCFATIGYAWVVISKTAGVDSFVGVMGDNTLDYQFSQIVDDELVESHNVEAQNSIPGEESTFVLTVENRGNKDSEINISFAKIFSEIDYADGKGYVKDYKQRYQKIQYAYSYCINLIVYVEDGLRPEKIYGNGAVTVPDENLVQEKGWIPVVRNTDYHYFNGLINKTEDLEYYPIIQNLALNHIINTQTPSPQNKTTILLYFTIKFNSDPIFPGAKPGSNPGAATPIIPEVPHDIDFNGEYYANQKFHISNLLIEGLK